MNAPTTKPSDLIYTFMSRFNVLRALADETMRNGGESVHMSTEVAMGIQQLGSDLIDVHCDADKWETRREREAAR